MPMIFTTIGRPSASSAARRRFAAVVLACAVATAIGAARTARAQSLEGLHVCIDPGHGGQGYSASYTGGFAGPAGLTESKATLDIALFLREQFRRHGAEVTMTRTKNRRVTPEGTTAQEELDARTRIAEDAGANLLISVHLSSSSKHPEINATRVFYSGEHADVEKLLGVAIGRSVSGVLGTTFAAPGEEPNRVIATATMPGVIVEVSSISNPGEEARLAKLSYARKAAQAIFDGFIVGYDNIPAQMLEKTGIPPAPPGLAKLALHAEEGAHSAATRSAAGPADVAPTPDVPAFRPPPVAEPKPRPTPRPTPAVTPSPTPPATPPTPTPRPTPRPRPTVTPAPTPPPPAPAPEATDRQSTPGAIVPLRPMFKNPVTGAIDQAWLYGESYNNLPLQTGLCFDAPEDSLVVAAAAGIVEMVVPYGEKPPDGTASDVAPYEGMVLIRHDDVRIGGEPVWTVYGRMPAIYVSPGEKVAALEVLGKSGRPYDGTPESRASAFLFEVRVGHNSCYKSVNPSPLITRPAAAPPTGAVALRIVDEAGVPLEGIEVRGAKKPGMPRFGYALSYRRGANPNPDLAENLYIGDLPPGRYRLTARDAALNLEVKADRITTAVWTLRNP